MKTRDMNERRIAAPMEKIVSIFAKIFVATIAALAVGGAFAADESSKNACAEIDLAKATIVVGQKALEPELFAAEELAKYAEKMCGAKLATAKENDEIKSNAVLLGTLENNGKLKEIVEKEKIDTGKLDKEHDGFIIKTIGDKLVLVGSNPRSVLYGVYALLEHFGCLWPAPGEDYVPALKKLDLGNLDDIEIADIDYRMCYGEGIKSVAWLDWLAKNRINWIEFWQGASPSWDDWKKKNIDTELIKRGILVEFGVDGAVTYFLPPVKYYKEHPEYYALLKGESGNKNIAPQLYAGLAGNRIKHQVCVSNPDVIRLEAENIIEFLRNNPAVGAIRLTPGDGYDYCECDRCMELDKPLIKCKRNSKSFVRSNSFVMFQNQVLKLVRKEFPGIIFTKSCYAGYMEPPRMAATDIDDNLLSSFCYYIRCASHAICDEACKKNQEFRSDSETWAKWHGSKKKVILYDEDCGMACHACMPLPIVRVLAKDFPYYKEFGGTVIWYSKLYVLNDYVAMRLAWNVNAGLDKMLDDYFNAYYGKAGELMRAYYMGWEDAAERLNSSGKHWNQAWRNITLYVNEEELKKFEDIIIQANQVPESAEIKKRIKEVEAHFNYTKNVWLAIKKLDAVKRYEKAGNTEQAAKAQEDVLEICDKITGLLPYEWVTGYILSEVAALPSSIKERPANTNDFNGGFGYGFFNWIGRARHKRGRIDTNEFHSGKQCLKFSNPVPEDESGLAHEPLMFNQKEPKPIRIGGWNKVKETIQGSGRFCIYVDFTYADGTKLYAQKVEFDREPHDWKYGEKIIAPEKPIKSANAYVFFENNLGTTWFDDICVEEVK